MMHTITNLTGRVVVELTDEQNAVYNACCLYMKESKSFSRFKWSPVQVAAYVKQNSDRFEEAAAPAICVEFKQELTRQRRNKAARQRNDALRSLGLTKTPYGWE